VVLVVEVGLAEEEEVDLVVAVEIVVEEEDLVVVVEVTVEEDSAEEVEADLEDVADLVVVAEEDLEGEEANT
jgi:hypothetical protein